MNAQEPAGLDRVVESIEQQIGWCRDFASPFTAMVLELIRDNLVRGGALVALVVPWPGEPMRDVLALRLAGVLQMMARTGLAPRLVPFYPAGSANPDRAGFAREIEAAVAANAAYVRDFISRPPQTNEIGRSAALMPAYAGIARRTGLPLRILEVGASAGLNMMWDRFRYRLGEHELGEARSPVTVSAEWRGVWPGVTSLPRVVERRGCDRTPIDLCAPGEADRLMSYMWPDQSERAARLEGAIKLAQEVKPVLDKADAGDWLEQQLRAPVSGVATIVAHSIAWQYFSKETSRHGERALREAGARASAEAPLARVALEHYAPDKPPALMVTQWPGGETRTLANAHAHGAWVEWLAG
ncbi:MAG: DUF2332 family protein [Micropepsaceae bacterium]